MSRNLKSADIIVRLLLSFGFIVLYVFGIVVGPLSDFLAIVSGLILCSVIAQAVVHGYRKRNGIR